MFFKNNKNLIVFLFSFIFLILSFFLILTLNSELRRSVFSRGMALHDFYRTKKMSVGLKNRDFNLLSKKLQEHIEFSRLISQGKNFMFHGIYYATELAVSRAIEQEDYNYLEDIFQQLIELDSRVYKPHVWYARSLSDSDIEKALEHLDIAIKISPSESDAYREIIRIGQNLNDKKIITKYCKMYKDVQSGGSAQKNYTALFGSFNSDKFAIKLFSKDNTQYTDYLSSTILINKNNDYEFLLSQELSEVGGLNLYFSTNEALKIKFKNIYYYDDNRNYEIGHKDITITSQNSYIEENEENISVFLIPKKDAIIRIKHDYKENIKKIIIEMNITKMNLVGKSLCGR